ncbi:hypothetical protein J7T55_005384 [Diaporthe amygdali]|uniref:uncharacterized protein n=1 Tax=Phomopsis amygdali TaxID=1214568 RepID=UPI0022FE9421|nr:uncharacterized protein J7T55_005384 [Diaporthe amygdali]KAJ0108407.1 hypothetical protein J7T55_005384 [Diaporthe amygdali]
MSTSNVLDMPAMEPPPGVVPNFDNPSNQNTMALAIMSLCLTVTTVTVSLRFYSRWAVLGMLQLQDYLLLVTFGIYVAILGIYYGLTHSPGWFVHMWDLRARDFVEFMRIIVITTYMLLFALMPIKTAILVEWISIFLPDTGNRRRNAFFWICHFIIWANIIYCVVTIIVYSLSCVPFEYLWNRTIENGYCRMNTAYTSLWSACFLFLTDIIILIIPQRVIWKLNMSRSRKLGVSVVFTFGMAACAASVVRLYYGITRIVNADATYHLSSLLLTGVCESTCTILVLCIPAVPKALHGLKSSAILSSIPSWCSLVSFIHRGPSHKSVKKAHVGTATTNWPHEVRGGNHKHWQIGSSSERHLVPLGQLPGNKRFDPELGITILRRTEFEANASYEHEQPGFAEQHSRQHPWI